MIIEKKNVEKNAVIGLWQMIESVDSLLEFFNLDPFIIEKVYTFTSDKRKLEFLSVRALLTEMTNNKKEILYRKNGKPYLADRSYKISITHTGEFAAIIMHPTREVGIDIEKITEKLERVKFKFLSETELKNLDQRNERTHLALHWAAKEALYKLIQIKEIDYINHIQIEPFEPHLVGEIHANVLHNNKIDTYTLNYQVYHKFVMVWVVK